MAEIGSILKNRFKILDRVGEGGMSNVYLALDTQLNKYWAVKEVLKKGCKEKDIIIRNTLIAEADLLKELSYPALPRIVDKIDNGETISIVMDYIEGKSLDKVLEEDGAQTEEAVIDWAKQLCDVLRYLHKQEPPIIYRDMKPGNIMVNSENKIMLHDFGTAGLYRKGELANTTVIATNGYAPLEQYKGQADARSDIYALGKTIYHLLTGEAPRGEKEDVPVRMVKPELSKGIEVIVEKCTQINPENRYPSCEDLLYELNHVETVTKEYETEQKRKALIFIIAAAFTIAFAVAGIVCNMLATQENNHSYDRLVSPSEATSLEDKISSYKQAIEIYPERLEAYMSILEAYEDEGKFGGKENGEFLDLYNRNKDNFDITSKEYAELIYKAGMMYFNYYTDDDGKSDFGDRIQKAYSFFAINYENKEISPEFEYKKLSDCYYQVCYFYKKYILKSASVEEASKDNYYEVFEVIESELEDVESVGAYDQLIFYNGTIMFLHDQRVNMVQVNVDENDVLNLMEKVFQKASALSVQKEQSQKLQNEITDNYKNYWEDVQRVYANAEERAEMNAEKEAE